MGELSNLRKESVINQNISGGHVISSEGKKLKGGHASKFSVSCFCILRKLLKYFSTALDF